MLEGVSREAGPFEFVVCADGARAGRRVRAGLGLCAWAGGWARLSLALEVQECARGPVDDGVRVPGTVRAGPFAGSGNPFLRSWALLVAVWAASLGYHLWG